MQITINQKKISLTDKFDIVTDGEASHAASAELFRYFWTLDLFSLENSQPVLKVQRLWYWFSPKFDILLHDNNILNFRTQSFWKRHYRCQRGPDVYDIYG